MAGEGVVLAEGGVHPARGADEAEAVRSEDPHPVLPGERLHAAAELAPLIVARAEACRDDNCHADPAPATTLDDLRDGARRGHDDGEVAFRFDFRPRGM